MNLKILLVVVLGILFLIITPFTFYTVDEGEQAVVLQFGKPVRVIVNRVSREKFAEIAEEIRSSTEEKVGIAYGAGLYMKIPFLQTLKYFQARLMEYDEEPRDILMGDKYQLRIDSYARWRVRNPLRFLRRVQHEDLAKNRLRDIIASALRKELGRHSHFEIIRSTTRPIQTSSLLGEEISTEQPRIRFGRKVLMERVLKLCDETARAFGIQIVDVRVKRADLPPENAESVYNRMKEERNRIATRYINEGSRESQKIMSDTDRRVKVITAEAEKQRLEIIGKADAEAARIYSEGFNEKLPDGTNRHVKGYGEDPEFYRFIRKLETLRESVGDGDRLILSTRNPLFEILNARTVPGDKPK